MLRKEFQSIGRNMTEFPWCYLSNPVREFTRARQECQECQECQEGTEK